MRRARASGSLVFVLVILLPTIVWGQHLPVPGPRAIFPALDSPGYVAHAPETFEAPPPRGYAEDIGQAKQDAAWVGSLPSGAIQYDTEAIPSPGWARPFDRFGTQQESQPQPAAPPLGTNFNGISYTGWIPPDPVIAAGPSNLVLVTNGSVTIRTKTGTLVASTSLEAFFGSARASGENAFDPKVVFDTGSNRFFLEAIGQLNNPSCTVGTCVSHFFLGVSKNSAPTTTGSSDWYFYSFDATLDGSTPTTNWADFPGLSVDDSAVVLTANMFSFSTNTFQRAKIRIFDKSRLIAGASVTWTDFVGMTDPSTGFLSFTLQPALTFGSPGTFFLVSASRTSGSCDMVVWGIMNPLSSPTLNSKLATASGSCTTPPDAKQLGGGTLLDTGDKRLNNSVYRNNSLWTAQAINVNFGSGNVSAIRWVEIDLASWPSSVIFLQDATFGADGIWYFYPTVMVDASSNLAIALSRSSAAEYASAFYTGRQGAEASNTLQPSGLLKAGAANYTALDSLGRNRWGDYLGIALDPSDGSFWVLGEYAVSSTTWGTWVGQVTFESFTLTVTKDGMGSGTVTSSPSGIDCGSDCSESYNGGSSVTLTATPAAGSLFGRWSGGGCSGTGTCTVTLDADTTVTATFVTPLAVASPLDEGEVNIFYDEVLISGGLPPYTVTLSSSFPAGLNVDSSDGTLSGTPTAAGSKSVTVTVTDELGTTVKKKSKVKIFKAVTITTTSLKEGTVGKNYSKTLKATGGKKPYTWSLVSGSLSDLGLGLESSTGKITGIPTAAAVGIHNLTFQVDDALGGTDQQSLTLTIN